MIQGILIALVVVLGLGDSLPGLPLFPGRSDLAVALFVVCTLGGVALLVQLFMMRCGRMIDRTGRVRYLAIADSVLSISRIVVLLVHVAAVLGFGWLHVVRRAIGGDWVLIDEAIAVAPAVLTLLAGWASYYAIDRRLREASLLGLLDTGEPISSLPTRSQYVAEQARHHVLMVLIPVGFLATWTETFERAHPWIESMLPRGGPFATLLMGALHFGGVIVLLAVMPLVLRRIWRTTSLGPGPLRDRLDALCRRQGVRCRDYLVWHTHTGLINGAMVGIIPQLRYILLTEPLLQRLPIDQVEAVMAHEVAHARRWHLPWLLIVLMSTLGLAWAASAMAFSSGAYLLHLPPNEQLSGLVNTASLVAAVAVALFVFSWVSRKFERQADAFGAQHLSGMARRGAEKGATIDAPAAEAMIGALSAVANINRIPTRKFSWRHGSIRGRQDRLREIIGHPIFPLPIDRQVRWIKVAAAVALLALIALAVVPGGR